MAAAAVAGVEALAGAVADRADRVRPAWAVPEARVDREVPGREAIDVTRGVPDPAVPGARADREVPRPD